MSSKVSELKILRTKVISWLQLFIDSNDPIADGLIVHHSYGLCSNAGRTTTRTKKETSTFQLMGRMSRFVQRRNPSRYGSSTFPIYDKTSKLNCKDQYHYSGSLYEGKQLQLRKLFAQDVIDSLHKYNLVTLGLLTQEEYDNED